MPRYLSSNELHHALTIRDLSDPAAGPHAMQDLLNGITNALAGAWQVPHRVIRLSPLVSVADNYDRLGFTASDVTRDQRYSRYISPTVMLRSHTSASVPSLLRNLAARLHSAEMPEATDELWVIPGLVYRRDAIDRTHVGTPHQVDLWRVSSRDRLTAGDLQDMAAELVEAVLPGARWRTVPAVHPYTEHGLQIDVLMDGEWLELAECGLMALHLFTEAGLDPRKWTGLALGMGLDRALMLRKGIPDIRMLRSTDSRVKQQLQDLSPWKPVSAMPPVRRDISIVVAADLDEEVLGDQVRSALGAHADDLESVELLALTPYGGLPPSARDRLRLAEGQANALVRLVLRPLDRTLTDPEANRIRDDVYLALHKGPVAELITR